ncbi:MAG: CAP domain-containing protein [Bacteroidia bacterium]
MKTLLLVLLFPVSCILCAQELDSSIINQCNTAKNAAYLTQAEKDVILYLNLVRTHPDEFSSIYLDKTAKRLKLDTTYEYRSLKEALKGRAPAGLLTPNEALTIAGPVEHAMDMGTTGMKGHASSSGVKFSQRIRQFKGDKGECIDYKNTEGLMIVCHLLIDHKEPTFGHRKIILNPVYKTVGTAIRPHIKSKFICVIDFLG